VEVAKFTVAKKARQVRSNVKSMLIFFFFSTSKELSTRNSYPWSNRQWEALLSGFEAAEGGHSAQTSRQVEEQQLVSPP
jgi:1,4-alpha-glucan branching enzyme